MQRQPSFPDLIELIDSHVAALSGDEPPYGGTVWYLLNHLRKLQGNARSSASAKEVSQSINSLARFSVDSLEWDGDLFQRIREIQALHAEVLRHEF